MRGCSGIIGQIWSVVNVLGLVHIAGSESDSVTLRFLKTE